MTASDLSDRFLWLPQAVDQLMADEKLSVASSGHGHDLAIPGKVVWALADQLGTVRDLAERFDNDWLAAASRVRLGLLAIARGSLDDAGVLFDDALGISLAGHNTYNLILCLAGFAQLALAEGDADRAAMLAGAANGLRRRAGLEVFTALTGEVLLVGQIRQALEADRFDRAFAAGLRLKQQQAVALVRRRHHAGSAAPLP